MPVYEYRCEGCSTRFEELVSASAPPPPCPSCGSTEITRILSAFSTEWKPSIVKWHRMPYG